MGSLGRDFRDVVGAFPTGVCVITTELHGHPAGMTMNSFTSVSLDPLLVLLSFIRESRTYPATIASGRFAVNILHRRQQEVALAFANRGAAFPAEHTVVDQYGYVAVRHALALLRCEVSQVVPAGDHDVVIGEVVSFEGSGGDPLVFHRGRFGGVDEDAKVPSGRVIGLGDGAGW